MPRFRPRGGGPSPLARLRGVGSSRAVETVSATILLALATTAVLPIPRAGGWLALGIIAASGLLYLGRITEAAPAVVPLGSTDDEDGGDAEARGGAGAILREAARLALAVAFAFAVAGTFRLADGSGQVAYDPASPLELALIVGGFALWLALPLAALALVARDELGRLGARAAMAAAFRRPVALIATLLAPLLLTAALEGLLLAIFVPTSVFGLAVSEVAPLTPGYVVENDLLRLDGEFVFPKNIEHGAIYRRGLARGATLIGSIPSSMTHGLTPRVLVPPYGDIGTEEFLATRLLVCLAAFGALYGIFAWQSARLGLLVVEGAAEEDMEEDDEDAAALVEELDPRLVPGGSGAFDTIRERPSGAATVGPSTAGSGSFRTLGPLPGRPDRGPGSPPISDRPRSPGAG